MVHRKEYGQDRFPRGGENEEERGENIFSTRRYIYGYVMCVSCIWLWSQHGVY